MAEPLFPENKMIVLLFEFENAASVAIVRTHAFGCSSLGLGMGSC